MKKILCILVLLLGVSLSACTKEEKEVLNVGMVTDTSLGQLLQKDDVVLTKPLEIVKELGESLDKEINIVPLSKEEITLSLKLEYIDIATPSVIGENVTNDFIDSNVYSEYKFKALSKNSIVFDDIKNLNTSLYTIVYSDNIGADKFVKNVFTKANVKVFVNEIEALEYTKKNENTIFISSDTLIEEYKKVETSLNEVTINTEETVKLGFLLRRKDTDLIKKVNDFLTNTINKSSVIN